MSQSFSAEALLTLIDPLESKDKDALGFSAKASECLDVHLLGWIHWRTPSSS